MKKKYLISLILTCTLYSINGQSALEIAQRSQEVVRTGSLQAVSQLIIKDNRGNERLRKCSMASLDAGKEIEKRIIKFTYPPEIEGTGILIFDHKESEDDMWIYLPSLKKTRRIVSSEKSNSFMGSEFTNADMSAPSLSDFSYKILRSSDYRGISCWILEVRPINELLADSYGYSYATRWIGNADYVVRKTEYYNRYDELVKTIETLNFRSLDRDGQKYLITEMLAKNEENGRTSYFTIEEYEMARPDEKYFNVSYLER